MGMAIIKCLQYLLMILLPLAAYGLVRLLRCLIHMRSLKRGILKRFSTETLLVFVSMLCFVGVIEAQVKGFGHLTLVLAAAPFIVWGCLDDAKALRFSWRSLLGDAAGAVLAAGVLAALIWHLKDPKLYLGALGDKGLALQNSFFLLLSWMLCYMLADAVLLLKGIGKGKEPLPIRNNRWAVTVGFASVLAAWAVLALMTERMGFGAQDRALWIVYMYLTEPVPILNLYILLFLYCFFYYLFGKGIALILNIFVFLFALIANMIKLKFHGTFFTWLDLLQIKDGVVFLQEMMTPLVVAAVAAAVALIVFLIVKFRKPIGRFLKPRCRIFLTAGAAGIFAFFAVQIFDGGYEAIEIGQRTWENEAINVEYNGLLVNMLYNLETVSEINMKKPEGYSQENAEALAEQFDALYPDSEDDVQPDVILILAESLFDLDGVEGMTFSEPLDGTIDQYSPATMLSPRFGGYTSAIEFEVLTGLTLAYMPNGLTPYTTYFNNPEEEFPCIVREFDNNGYSTKIMHPGLPNFYNRTIVYRNFGFDEYMSIESFDMSKENTTENGWLLDVVFGQSIIDELQSGDEPQFIFGITYEGHYVNMDKFEETQIKASSSLLSEETLHQVEQQAQAYYDTDKMIAEIIDYMDNTDRPTLLYVFGDHLPPINALGELGYTYDVYNKYSTKLVMYSNYKTIEVEPDYITPNQIAAQIMMDSGISHSSYYDYIYSLRDAYPVIHKEFVDVEDNADLEDYYYIQYDILMGEHYLYEK